VAQIARDPFPLAESSQKIASSQLDSLSTLLKSPHKLQVLEALERQANEVKVRIWNHPITAIAALIRRFRRSTGDDSRRNVERVWLGLGRQYRIPRK